MRDENSTPLFSDEEVEDLMAYTISYKKSDKNEVYAFALQLRDAVEKRGLEDRRNVSKPVITDTTKDLPWVRVDMPEEKPKHVVHYMKVDKDGNPYGLGSIDVEEPAHFFTAPDGTVYGMSSKSHAVKDNWRELAEQEKNHWEPVVRNDGVRGRVFIYYKNDRQYASVPEYDIE